MTRRLVTAQEGLLGCLEALRIQLGQGVVGHEARGDGVSEGVSDGVDRAWTQAHGAGPNPRGRRPILPT